MYSKRDSSKVTTSNDANKIIQNLFNSLLQKYEIGLEQSMKGSNFGFDLS